MGDTVADETRTAEGEQAARVYWSAEGWLPGGVIRDVDYSQESGGLDPMFAGIKIVDTDTHIVEPPTLFTARAPAGMKDKMPHVKRDGDGVDRWFIGDRNCGTLGGNVIRKDNNKLLGRLAFPTLEESHPGGHELKPRLQAMDDMGVCPNLLSEFGHYAGWHVNAPGEWAWHNTAEHF